MSENSRNSEENTDLGYGKLFNILWQQRFWVLGVFTGFVALTTPFTLNQKATYESSMQLLVDANYQAPKNRVPDLTSEFADSSVEIDYATQLSLMRSSELLQQAINQLKSVYPNLTIKDLRRALSLSQVEEDEIKTKIFQIVFIGDDPDKAQQVLEAVKTVYLSYNLEQQQARLARGLNFIDAQLPIARQELGKAQQALERFRQTHNLIDPNQQAGAISKNLNQLQQHRQELQEELDATQSQIISVQTELGVSLDVSLASARLSESTHYQSLLKEFKEAEKELALQSVIYTDSAPPIVDLQGKKQQLLKLLRVQIEQILGDFISNSQLTDDYLLAGQYGDINIGLTKEWLRLQTKLFDLKAREASLAFTEDSLRQRLDYLPTLINEYEYLKPEVETTRATIEQLLAARQELAVALAQGGFNWQVVEEPQLGRQTGPNIKRSILLNIIGGLFLAGAAAFIRNLVDKTLHTPDEVSTQLQLPLLGVLPAEAKQKSALSLLEKTEFLNETDLIYKKIQLLTNDKSWSSLLITSALEKEGKSILALYLAFSASRLGEKVLLLDANIRNPQLHKYLRLPNEKGLSTLLVDKQSIVNMLDFLPILTAEFNIDVLTAGPSLEDALILLSSTTFGQLLEYLGTVYDRVIIDTMPLLDKVDALQLASLCDTVCLVSQLNQMTEATIDELQPITQLIKPMGIIANLNQM
ncbi:polysaccharide biosynthesis tyrosine autokinase [Leptothoe sp. ISB3NOV94-8A]